LLQAWLHRARVGEAFEYHRGLLAVERNRVGSPMTKAKRQALDRLANAAWALAEQGLVHLVQRRIELGAFSYLAIARQVPGPATPSVQHVQEACR
jgi:hypothetical protein